MLTSMVPPQGKLGPRQTHDGAALLATFSKCGTIAARWGGQQVSSYVASPAEKTAAVQYFHLVSIGLAVACHRCEKSSKVRSNHLCLLK